MRKPELLAPGGSLEKCKIAFLYGADAVYVGGRNFSLRSYARNLDTQDLAEAAFLARTMGKKLYVAVNIYARQADLTELPAYLQYLEQIGVDGLIVSDPAVLFLARQHAPSRPIHLSTQANTTNSLAAAFWRDQGVQRINLARELSFGEIADICTQCTQTDLELEIFVHGAMCVSYSGRCLLSAFINERSANRGACTQPCRWTYDVIEHSRPQQRFGLHQDKRGSYIFNSKDLCLLEEMGRLMTLNIAAFKIEGRMKGALYLASVTRSYRQAIDRYWQRPSEFRPDPNWRRDLDRVSHRPYTQGLLFPESADFTPTVSDATSYLRSHCLAGLVRKHPESHPEHPARERGDHQPKIALEVRTRLVPNTALEFLFPDGSAHWHRLTEIRNLRGEVMAVAHPNTTLELRVPFQTFPHQVVRMRTTEQPHAQPQPPEAGDSRPQPLQPMESPQCQNLR